MKTKFYRVCRSGKTIDGREITPQQIDEMAASYDPKTYGARINCEHLLSMLPAGTPFQAYGDVLALKAETDEQGNRVLLAQLDVTDELVKMNKARQKVYWSIEMAPNFAGTGKAYLCGLAVTDTPASLGTELIKLSAKHPDQMAGAGDKLTQHLFSEAVEGSAVLEEDPGTAPKGPSLLTQINEILRGKKGTDEGRFAQLEESVTVLATGLSDIKTAIAALAAGAAPQQTDQAAKKTDADADQAAPVTRAEFKALVDKLNATPQTPGRQPHDGTPAGASVTDC